MKSPYIKSNRFRLFFALLLVTASIIYGCRKDILKSDPSLAITDPKIAQAKNWYEQIYPKQDQKSITKTFNAVGETEFDWSQFVKPDWSKPVNYTRFDDDVLEMPLDASGTDSDAYAIILNGLKDSFGNSQPAYLQTLITKYNVTDVNGTYESYRAGFSGTRCR